MGLPGILDAMHKLIDCHDSMLELADQKKDALRTNNIDHLNQVVHKESQIIRQISDLDKAREDAVGQFLVQRGFYPNPSITVTELTKLLFKAEEKKSLLDTQRQLLERLEKLKEVNQVMQQLLQDAMAYVEFSLDLLLGRPVDEPVYQRPSSAPSSMPRLNVFDTRA